MTRTIGHPFRIGRKSRHDVNCSRPGVTPGPVEVLERRGLLSIVSLAANASPTILRQINPMNQPHAVQVTHFRPVTLTAYVGAEGAVPPTVSYRVVDEYGRDQPSGVLRAQPAIPAQPDMPAMPAMQGRPATTDMPATPPLYFFATRIGLSRTHRPGDRDGRQYTVFITAQDPVSMKMTAIIVTTPPGPHVHKRP